MTARPELHYGDAWTYRGIASNGSRYTEMDRIVGAGKVAGIPTYLQRGERSDGVADTAHVTQEGLNPVNETGFVTELLRFPLAEDKNWTYGYQRTTALDKDSGPWAGQEVHEQFLGAIRVVGLETITTPAGTLETWHLRANITSSTGAYTKTMTSDYWYSPGAKALARVDTRDAQGARSWSELTAYKIA